VTLVGTLHEVMCDLQTIMPFELEVYFGRSLPHRGWDVVWQLNGYLAVEFLHRIGVIHDKDELLKAGVFDKITERIEQFRQEEPSLLKYEAKLK